MGLRDYQQEAITAINESFGEDVWAAVCAMATGLGKTHVGIGWLEQTLNGGRALWLAHRNILVEQPMSRLLKVFPVTDLGVVRAHHNQVNARVMVGSVQTLARENRVNQLLAAGPIDLIVTDEAHRAPSPSYRRIYEAIRGHNPAVLHMGLTATPWRSDGKWATGEWTFQAIPRGAQKNIRWGIRHGWLAPPEGLQIETHVNISGVKVVAGDFAKGELADVLEANKWHEKVVDAYFENCLDGERHMQAIAFTPTVATSKRLAQEFRDRGINAVHVDGSTPIKKRRPVEKAFRNREVTVVCNCAVYGEGADFPSVEVVLMARPTRSHGLFTQIVGRGLRPYPGKERCLVLLFATTGAQILTLFDLGKSKALKEAEEKAEELGVRSITGAISLFDDELIDGVGVEASIVSLFGGARDAWYRASDGIFSLGLGENGSPLFQRTLVVLPPNGDTEWHLLGVGRSVRYPDAGAWEQGRRKCGPWKVKELLSSPDIEELMDYATGVSDRRGLPTLVKKKKSWRKDLASAAQVKYLRRWGIKGDLLSKGDAGRLITHHTALDALKSNGYL